MTNQPATDKNMRTVDVKGEKPEPLPFDASLIVLVAVPVPLAVPQSPPV
jgi:hypothetical protein